MTFYEYMQQQLKRRDDIGNLAFEMSMIVKLFPSFGLEGADTDNWQAYLANKWSEAGRDEVFGAAVKEYQNREVENDSEN